MTNDEQSLVKLNKETFAAEAHKPKTGWVDVLHRSLADDFRLRRAIGETEDRERMISRLSHTKPVEREILGDPDVVVLDNTAMVCSRVRVRSGTFRNAKLFEKTTDGWRCVYWRVTRETEA